MDDLAVARARLCAHRRVPLYQDRRRIVPERELACNGESDDTATNDLSYSVASVTSFKTMCFFVHLLHFFYRTKGCNLSHGNQV